LKIAVALAHEIQADGVGEALAFTLGCRQSILVAVLSSSHLFAAGDGAGDSAEDR
jgi:hypothetical protein